MDKRQIEIGVGLIGKILDKTALLDDDIETFVNVYDTMPDCALKLHIDLMNHLSYRLFSQVDFVRVLLKNELENEINDGE